ncbi:hypothetical protein KIPB_001320 [Kipferlia bialata]|uniref:Uncharacterized protein n=1 Tax=Kipferlia bialata TaxID=797122 RepID=A0A9K3CQ39_9EUKA|nr:hypothetical protein KIPB_000749 [Kipferlia bialata]GIQ80511.1 hypothetical protein KIPB_001320 [Kipferlia bialata]|eukprot:g749.t1
MPVCLSYPTESGLYTDREDPAVLAHNMTAVMAMYPDDATALSLMRKHPWAKCSHIPYIIYIHDFMADPRATLKGGEHMLRRWEGDSFALTTMGICRDDAAKMWDSGNAPIIPVDYYIHGITKVSAVRAFAAQGYTPSPGGERCEVPREDMPRAVAALLRCCGHPRTMVSVMEAYSRHVQDGDEGPFDWSVHPLRPDSVEWDQDLLTHMSLSGYQISSYMQPPPGALLSPDSAKGGCYMDRLTSLPQQYPRLLALALPVRTTQRKQRDTAVTRNTYSYPPSTVRVWAPFVDTFHRLVALAADPSLEVPDSLFVECVANTLATRLSIAIAKYQRIKGERPARLGDTSHVTVSLAYLFGSQWCNSLACQGDISTRHFEPCLLSIPESLPSYPGMCLPSMVAPSLVGLGGYTPAVMLGSTRQSLPHPDSESECLTEESDDLMGEPLPFGVSYNPIGGVHCPLMLRSLNRVVAIHCGASTSIHGHVGAYLHCALALPTPDIILSVLPAYLEYERPTAHAREEHVHGDSDTQWVWTKPESRRPLVEQYLEREREKGDWMRRRIDAKPNLLTIPHIIYGYEFFGIAIRDMLESVLESSE